MQEATTSSTPVQAAPPRDHLSALFRATVRHPAAWLFAALYVLAVVYLIAAHHANLLLIALIQLLAIILPLLIVWPMTTNAPPAAWEVAPPTTRLRLWLQLVLPLIVTGLGLLAFYALAAPFVRKLPIPAVVITLPVALLIEIVIPLVVVVALGASFREIGFGPGYRSWRVGGALVLLNLLLIGLILVAGWSTPTVVLLGTIPSFLTAALPEEILFRGIVMTRLSRLFGTGWGISLSSLLFGLYHIGTNMAGRDLGTALALCIVSQAIGGLGFAILFLRTHTILAVVLAHGMGDTLGLPLGKVMQPLLR
jgi:membrane protease YdiL (CAAX protease family)